MDFPTTAISLQSSVLPAGTAPPGGYRAPTSGRSFARYANPTPNSISPLILADRLITLAQDADRAGYADTASSLISLVYSVLEQAPPQDGA